MKRLVACLIGLVVITFGLFLPGLIPTSDNPAASTFEPTTITSYVADFDLAADGRLEVVETLTVDFPRSPSLHGIFRFWDRYDNNDTSARRNVEDISITMDGAPVRVDMSSKDRGRYTVARVGSPDAYVSPGQHIYQIAYAIDGVIIDGEGERPSAFYWNLIPAGWAQRIDSADLTVHLPAAAEAIRCGVGLGTEPPACDLTGAGTSELAVHAADLGPNTPVTLRTSLSIPRPASGNALPWPARFDPVLGTHPFLIGLVALLTAGTSALGLSAARRSVEITPPFPLMYAPPDGIGPAQASYVLEESNRDDAYVATLMLAAEKRAIDLHHDASGWAITNRNDPAAWAQLDPVTQGITHLIGSGTFTAKKKDVTGGKKLKAEMSRFGGDVKNWARQSGNLDTAGLGDFGRFLVIAAAAIMVVIGIWNPFSMSLLGLIPGGFAAGAASLLLPGASTLRTAKGRELWSRVGGFHRILSTPSSVDRFDFAGRQELYLAYLPWAVAFGCADNWASKYRTEMGTEPPLPIYFGPGHYSMTSSQFASSMVRDFQSTLSSAISSYEATQSSSSSGGGFSGGGGGGGGGGGSW
ncbi:MAG: DUF2207 domain-containing protein [Acidimicrobiales bacterium]